MEEEQKVDTVPSDEEIVEGNSSEEVLEDVVEDLVEGDSLKEDAFEKTSEEDELVNIDDEDEDDEDSEMDSYDDKDEN